jgi:phosphatidylinositol alpha-1,6-mannosyltransferase
LNLVYISHLHPNQDSPLENLGGMQRVGMQLLSHLEEKENLNIIPLVAEGSWETVEMRTLLFLARLLVELPPLVKEHDVDAILFSSMVTASVAPALRPHVNAAMIAINHGQDVTMPNSMYQRYIPKVFETLDGVISVSSATRQACLSRGLSAGKGTVLPNGYEDDWLDLLPPKEKALKDLRNKLNIDADRKIILTVGRQVKRKGHAWFIQQVLPKLKKPVDFLVIGYGPQHETISKLAHTNTSDSKVHILGRCSDEFLYTAYSAADLFVMPNIPVTGDMEGFGIVMLEAALAGTPTVASALEGIKDVIENGKNGYLIEPLNAEEFALQIDKILNHELEELSEKSRSYVTSNFNWDHVAGYYFDYVKKIVERRKSPITA